MADFHQTERKRATWFGKFFGFWVQLFLALLLGLITSIVVEWIGMAFFYGDEGYLHAKRIYDVERDYLAVDFKKSFMTSSPIETFKTIKESVYHYCVKSTGIESLVLDLNERLKIDESSFYLTIRDYLLSAIYMTQVYSIRVSVLFLAIPVLIFGVVYGAGKGLNARSVRRWSGGRESATIFHWAKMLWGKVFMAPFVVYLAIPFSVHPSMVILPCVASIAYNTFIVTASYKKYI